ncbi:MAG: ATP-binding protein [Chloroflexota bacterium]
MPSLNQIPSLSFLRENAEQTAAIFAQTTGAKACYLSLAGNAGHHPRLLVVGGLFDDSPRDTAEIASLLQCADGYSSVLEVSVNRSPGVALALASKGRHIGSTVLVYDEDASIDVDRVEAAAPLAAQTLDYARQVAVLHLRTEEIEERARLREIQVSRNLIRGVIDSIPLGLILLSSEGTILAVNRALSDRFHLAPATLVGMNYSAISSWEESPAAHAFTSGTGTRVRRAMNREDGSQSLLEVASFPLLDNENQPFQVVEVWEDITERVSLQTQLVRAEKLAAIGQLAASIAHEVGNPLQAIQGFLSLFLEQCDQGTPNLEFLKLADEEIERIVKVISRLRDLYRSRADVIDSVCINDIIDGILLLASKQLEQSDISVSCDLDANLPVVQGIADQLKQVLLNLVLNASDAMPDGGELRIQTTSTMTSDHVASVTITLSDTGVGIAPDQLPHIFDGLHTTKERGMGLGLYTSKAIIERHMGRISVQSKVGNGTTFTIVLPTNLEEDSP